MNPLSPKQILRNLENGFFMTHQEQTEAAQLIRQLQESNQALFEGMIKYADEIVKLRRDLHNPTGFNVDVTEFAERIKDEERKSYADMLSALRAIIAVAETETSFSMQTIKDCAKIAIAQTTGKK